MKYTCCVCTICNKYHVCKYCTWLLMSCELLHDRDLGTRMQFHAVTCFLLNFKKGGWVCSTILSSNRRGLGRSISIMCIWLWLRSFHIWLTLGEWILPFLIIWIAKTCCYCRCVRPMTVRNVKYWVYMLQYVISMLSNSSCVTNTYLYVTSM